MYVSGVPENEIHASFGTFALTGKNEKLLSLVQRWSSNPEWAFLALLSPQKGIGKTRLAISAMAQHFIDHAGVARRNEHGLLTPNVFDGYMIFTQEADIALRIRDTFGNEDNGVTEKDILDELYKAEFLVVDDLFSIKATDFNRQNVLNVLENRMNTKGKRTVFTSNFHLEDFKQIDERLFSRLSDGNKGMVININNTSMKDYRQERQEVHTL
jgi:DNA replication protein DnaC